MDPLSLAVGITGLVSLVGKTIKLSTLFVKEARRGQDAAAELLEELDILSFNLHRLDGFLRNTDQLRGKFSDTSVLVSSTFACRSKVTILYDKLSRANNSRLARLSWPIDTKEHHETIETLRAYAQCCQFSLTISGCMLLASSSAELQKILTQQLDAFKLLERVDTQARSLEQSLNKQAQLQKESHAAEERARVLNWISTVDHEEKHHDVRSRRLEGTGEWFLDERLFQRWRDEPQLHNNTLLCQGIQGSGKSVLASLVIDRLREHVCEQNAVVAHLYFNYRDQVDQTPEKTVASLLKQVAAAKQITPKPVSDLYQKLSSQERRPPLQDLEQAFLSTCQTFNRVFLIVDALDECDIKYRKGFLRSLSILQSNQCLSIFVTSRSYEDHVNQLFGSCPRMKIQAQEPDLRKFLLNETHDVDTVDEDLKKAIVDRIVQGAHNMFLLAALQVRTVMHEPTIGEMHEALDTLPRGLDDAFEETLSRIQRQPEGRKKLGMNTLMWITNAKRPLLVSELSDALAIRPGITSLNPLYRPSQKLMVESCLGLVTVNEQTSIIRLVHYSVQQFFEKHQKRIFPMGESAVAELTTTYSMLEEFASGSRSNEEGIQTLISQNPFSVYAACFWGHHVRNAKSPQADELALVFLRSSPHRVCSYQISRYTAGLKEIYWEAEEANSCNGILMAAAFGLEGLAKTLLEDDQAQIDSMTKMGTTALIRAAASGNLSFMQMLLDRGADKLKENWYGSAIHCAAEAGQVGALIELLTRGLEVDIRDRRGRTALHCATIEGHVAAMRTLLTRGADVNAKCSLREQVYTPLRYAVVCEQPPEVVKALLMSGANTESRSRDRLTPLHDAAAMCLEDIMSLLLDFGADIHARSTHGHTALHTAAVRNHVAIIHILLDHGADRNARTVEGFTPLYLAAERGAEETVRALVDSDADIEAEDNEGSTAVHAAIKENHRSIVQILLEAGASTTPSSRDGVTAPRSTQENGSQDIGLLMRNNTKRKALGPASDYQEEAALTLMTYRFKSRESMGKAEQRCTECDKSFERPCDLTKHQKTHSRPWKCSEPSCKYHEHGWPTEKERDRHFNDKHCSIPHKFKCQHTDCAYTSKRESNLKQHMERAHEWVYHRSRNVKRVKTDPITRRHDNDHWRDSALTGSA